MAAVLLTVTPTAAGGNPLIFTPTTMTATYPTQQDAVLLAAAERLMVETMARYDPSHDAHHGLCHSHLSPLDTVKFTPHPISRSTTRQEDRLAARAYRVHWPA